jgi:hypothetical protein
MSLKVLCKKCTSNDMGEMSVPTLLHAAVNPYESNVPLNSAALAVIPYPVSTHMDTLNYSVSCRFSLRSVLPTDYISVSKTETLWKINLDQTVGIYKNNWECNRVKDDPDRRLTYHRISSNTSKLEFLKCQVNLCRSVLRSESRATNCSGFTSSHPVNTPEDLHLLQQRCKNLKFLKTL